MSNIIISNGKKKKPIFQEQNKDQINASMECDSHFKKHLRTMFLKANSSQENTNTTFKKQNIKK